MKLHNLYTISFTLTLCRFKYVDSVPVCYNTNDQTIMIIELKELKLLVKWRHNGMILNVWPT